jgi:hypothetical protein
VKRTLLALTWAAAAGIGVAAAQSQQQPQQKPGQQPAQQGQEQQQERQQTPQAKGQMVTFTGCVYQASDEPTMFALRSMSEQSQAGASAAGQTGAGAAGRPETGATGTAGASSAGTAGTAGAGAGARAGAAAQGADGAWYRLSGSAAQDLKQYVGQGVRVSGTIMPGRDEKGADVVVHQIQPDKVTVTALDLKPAPQFQIQSITKTQADCAQGGAQR